MEKQNKKVSVISRLTFILESPHQRIQYVAGFLATLAMFVGGNFTGWASPVGIKRKEGDTPLQCSDSNWAWAVSFLNLGGVPGAILAGIFADKLGRRITLLISAPIYVFAWYLIYISHSCYTLFAARFIAGFGNIFAAAVCSLYIGEICEPNIRGRVGSMVVFMNNAGVLFSLSVGPYVSYKTFAIILSTIPIIFFVTFYWMPETPYYRLRQGRRDAAMKSLLKFRGLTDKKNLDHELDIMKDGVDSEMRNKTSFLELINHPMSRKAVIIVIGLKSMSHFSGMAAIHAFMAEIFTEAHSFLKPSLAAIVCGVVQLISGFFASIFIDRCGRKPLLLSSAIGTDVALFVIGLYFFFQNYYEYDLKSINWVPLASIILFMSAQSMGLGPISFVYLSELFPANLKGHAATVSAMYGTLCAFSITKLFDVISNGLDMFVTFWLCFVIVFGGIFFTIFFVPETKGKTLLQIQNDLNKKGRKKSPMVDVVA